MGKSLLVNESIINQSVMDWKGGGEGAVTHTVTSVVLPCGDASELRRTGGRRRPAYRPRRSAAVERASTGGGSSPGSEATRGDAPG